MQTLGDEQEDEEEDEEEDDDGNCKITFLNFRFIP
jgi:hypothetical protein